MATRRPTIPGSSHLQVPNPTLDDAVAVWNMLETGMQISVARDYLHTHRESLRRSYQGVTSAGYGFRVTANQHALAPVNQTVCLVFHVHYKWFKGFPRLRPNSLIPPYFLTQLHVRGKLRTCAIPTDIQGRQQVGEAKPQGNMYISAISTLDPLYGMPCCAVTYKGGNRFLMGCHHVFALSETAPNVPQSGVQIQQNQMVAGPSFTVANLSVYRGYPVPNGTFFDSALANVTNNTLLQQILQNPQANSSVIQNEGEIARDVAIYTARGTIRAQVKTVHHDYFCTEYGAFSNVTHPILVETICQNALTQGGDSGSPVFDQMGRFQGMHVAANGECAFYIPAFELLRASNYGLTSDVTDFLELA